MEEMARTHLFKETYSRKAMVFKLYVSENVFILKRDLCTIICICRYTYMYIYVFIYTYIYQHTSLESKKVSFYL